MAAQECRCTRVAAAVRPALLGLVVCVGAVSLIHDSWLIPLPHRGNLHTLFGLLLWLCVIEQFHARLNSAPRLTLADLRPLSRRLSQLVYLLLYGLMLLHLIIDLCAAPHHASFNPVDFQSYLICGVIALITIHLLAAACRLIVMPAADTVMPAAGTPPGLFQRNGRLT